MKLDETGELIRVSQVCIDRALPPAIFVEAGEIYRVRQRDLVAVRLSLRDRRPADWMAITDSHHAIM